MNKDGRFGFGAGLVRAAIALCVSVLGALPAAHAGQGAQASMQVSAVVLRHASIRVAPPPMLTISEADVARGYVEVVAPMEVMVQSNVPQGYTLVFQHDDAQVRQAVVQGLAGAVVVGAAGATAARPAAGAGMWRDTLQLRFRFDLSAGARAGQHPWPLQISMMSL